MLRLGSMLLTAVLMGVPRALDGRAFGTASATIIHVKVAPHDPDLAALADELERALAAASYELTPVASRATLVVEVHRLAREARPPDGERRALLVTLGEGRARRPIVVEDDPDQRRHAARALLDALPRPPQALH